MAWWPRAVTGIPPYASRLAFRAEFGRNSGGWLYRLDNEVALARTHFYGLRQGKVHLRHIAGLPAQLHAC